MAETGSPRIGRPLLHSDFLDKKSKKAEEDGQQPGPGAPAVLRQPGSSKVSFCDTAARANL
jgi:hypothetical protein